MNIELPIYDWLFVAFVLGAATLMAATAIGLTLVSRRRNKAEQESWDRYIQNLPEEHNETAP